MRPLDYSMSKNTASNVQYAALPYRRRQDGVLEVLLITSRDTGRWVIPKGWPMSKFSASEAAAREAVEEGGIVGRIGDQPIGRYCYGKRLENGVVTHCTVEVFALAVERQLDSWLEQKQRQTRWFPLDEAADAVQEPELSVLIRDLAGHLPDDSLSRSD
jgi:8-oxo-dGTP pyrophosphatase MutT (NUDIX family)